MLEKRIKYYCVKVKWFFEPGMRGVISSSRTLFLCVDAVSYVCALEHPSYAVFHRVCSRQSAF